MMCRPMWPLGTAAGSKPLPSSCTVSVAPPSTASTRAVTAEARACLAMLLNASCVTR